MLKMHQLSRGRLQLQLLLGGRLRPAGPLGRMTSQCLRLQVQFLPVGVLRQMFLFRAGVLHQRSPSQISGRQQVSSTPIIEPLRPPIRISVNRRLFLTPTHLLRQRLPTSRRRRRRYTTTTITSKITTSRRIRPAMEARTNHLKEVERGGRFLEALTTPRRCRRHPKRPRHRAGRVQAVIGIFSLSVITPNRTPMTLPRRKRRRGDAAAGAVASSS